MTYCGLRIEKKSAIRIRRSVKREKDALLAESEIVSVLRKRFGGESFSVVKGIGDDAAVIRIPGATQYWVLTTDQLHENVHFRREWTGPKQLGHKALAVNLSDVAAMGARPRFYVVALAIPRSLPRPWLIGFYEGMVRLGRKHQAILIGGDLSHSKDGLHISLAVLGESVRRNALLRCGGKPGDFLYVTGTLGKSAAGLRLLQAGAQTGKTPSERQALKAHREPEPRCQVGMWLARHGFCRAMMDLSDGLSLDLLRMCQESGTGAVVHGDRLPLFSRSRAWGCDPIELGLHGGEDYELLFAVPPRHALSLESAYPAKYPKITRIGVLTRSLHMKWIPESNMRPRPLAPCGFDHFRS